LKTLAAAAAALLALFNLCSLAAAGYATAAQRQLDNPESPKTIAAARIAARLAPWSAKYHALHGWVLAENHRDEESRAQYRRALQVAPADALLWAEYAQVLARLGHFDDTLSEALHQARALAPNSPAVQRTLADIGLAYYERGNIAQREVWVEAMGRELIRDRRTFLAHVQTRGQTGLFCRELAGQFHEGAWCASLPST
jgi:Flp pilus assembly protein TadD